MDKVAREAGSLWRRVNMTIALLLALVPTGATSHPSSGSTVFRRGVSLVGWYSWPASAPNGQHYGDNPFPERGRLSPTEIHRLRTIGFDFIRLPVDPGPLLDADPARRQLLLARIAGTVTVLRGAGLGVIWDYHPRGGTGAPYGYNRLFSPGGDQVQAFQALLGETAALLARSSFDVTLEIMNEPIQDCRHDAIDTDRLMQSAYATIRARAPRLPILIEGSCLASVDGLLASDPTPFVRDPQVLFSFHFYEPNLFALQGDPGNTSPFLRNLGRMPYPARLDGGQAIAQLQSNLARDTLSDQQRADTLAGGSRAIGRYLQSGADERLIAQRFGQISAWAAAHGITPRRILLGEFGATRFDGRVGAVDGDRARWIRDVRTAAEQAGFGWSFWAYFDPRNRMSLVFSGDRSLDEKTFNALGM